MIKLQFDILPNGDDILWNTAVFFVSLTVVADRVSHSKLGHSCITQNIRRSSGNSYTQFKQSNDVQTSHSDGCVREIMNFFINILFPLQIHRHTSFIQRAKKEKENKYIYKNQWSTTCSYNIKMLLTPSCVINLTLLTHFAVARWDTLTHHRLLYIVVCFNFISVGISFPPPVHYAWVADK